MSQLYMHVVTYYRDVDLLMCADDPEQSGCQHLLSTSTAVNLTCVTSHYYVLVLICILVMLN